MSHDNPYAAPEAEIEVIPEFSGLKLATRVSRLIAAVIDWVIALAFNMSVFALFRPYGSLVTMLIVQPALEFVFFLAVQGYLLKRNGQTVGKKLVGIRIVDFDGNVPSFGRLIGLRYLPVFLVTRIPLLGVIFRLIDVLFIFQADRRCLHDLLAGTWVVKGRPSEKLIEENL